MLLKKNHKSKQMCKNIRWKLAFYGFWAAYCFQETMAITVSYTLLFQSQWYMNPTTFKYLKQKQYQHTFLTSVFLITKQNHKSTNKKKKLVKNKMPILRESQWGRQFPLLYQLIHNKHLLTSYSNLLTISINFILQSNELIKSVNCTYCHFSLHAVKVTIAPFGKCSVPYWYQHSMLHLKQTFCFFNFQLQIKAFYMSNP